MRLIHNPFVEMEKHTPNELKLMTEEELIAVQRNVLFPHELEAFEEGGVLLQPSDGRAGFLDYTDALIQEHQIKGS